jgi:cell division protein FtsB
MAGERSVHKQTDRERPDTGAARVSMSPRHLEELKAENAALRKSIVALALEIQDLRERRCEAPMEPFGRLGLER